MDDELNAIALEVARLAAEAQAELDALVATNLATAAAVLKIQQRFNAAFVQVLAAGLNTAPSTDVWNVRQVREMAINDVTLAARLYATARQTSNEVAALVQEHTRGVMQARELAMRLYDGYNPRDGLVRPLEGAARAQLPKALQALTASPTDQASLQRVFDQGMRYAASLKTEPLKAAYMEAFEGWKQSEGMDALKRRLEIAHREKTRHLANRIAQTEVARAHSFALADELMQDDTIEVVQVLMSAAHPKFDVCDMHAKANLWGLGPGCYPKARAPRPTFHPFCRCRLRSRPDLRASDARELPGGEAAYLRSLPTKQATQVMGSRGKLQQALNGEPVLDVLNARTAEGYKTVRLGEVGRQNVGMNDAYGIATTPGGKHHGWYLQQLTKSPVELANGVKSFSTQIAKHTGWIADPLTKMADFYLIDPRRQKALLVGWQQDTDRHRDCIAILRGVLKQEKKP